MIDEQIIKLLSDQISAVGQKVDDYHSDIKSEISSLKSANDKLEDGIKLERERNDKQDIQQKVLRVWGLVALFAGGVGGTLVSNILL